MVFTKNTEVLHIKNKIKSKIFLQQMIEGVISFNLSTNLLLFDELWAFSQKKSDCAPELRTRANRRGQLNFRCISAKQQYFLLIRVSTYSGWLWEQLLSSSKLGCRAFISRILRKLENSKKLDFAKNGRPNISIWFSPTAKQNDVIFEDL